jgi:hypothetical protein
MREVDPSCPRIPICRHVLLDVAYFVADLDGSQTFVEIKSRVKRRSYSRPLFIDEPGAGAGAGVGLPTYCKIWRSGVRCRLRNGWIGRRRERVPIPRYAVRHFFHGRSLRSSSDQSGQEKIDMEFSRGSRCQCRALSALRIGFSKTFAYIGYK